MGDLDPAAISAAQHELIKSELEQQRHELTQLLRGRDRLVKTLAEQAGNLAKTGAAISQPRAKRMPRSYSAVRGGKQDPVPRPSRLKSSTSLPAVVSPARSNSGPRAQNRKASSK